MSNQVSTAFAKLYEAKYHELAQQRVSYFKDKVMVKEVSSAEEWYMDQYGAVSLSSVTGQRQAISLGNTPHSRRQVTKSDFYFADTVEERDTQNLLVDPTAAYTANALRAAERQIDATIIAAATADANTGAEGGTTTTFASESTTIVHGSAGLTYSKLLQIRKNFQNADLEPKRICLAVGPEQEEDLYNIAQFVNKDYRDASQLDSVSLTPGFVGRFMEFDIYRSTQLSVTSSVRDCLAWVDGGIGLIVGISPKVIIENRPDLVGSPTQIQVLMSIGASRLEGVRVQKIECQE